MQNLLKSHLFAIFLKTFAEDADITPELKLSQSYYT